jgi:hypothetical protein
MMEQAAPTWRSAQVAGYGAMREEEYLANAVECERDALRATSASVRKTWLEMAARWHRKFELAKSEEHRDDQGASTVTF